ncbi:MAG TPA: hypothetical protein VM076_02395, partial [Gemmatimonadaceae bacterium]|nr:hypothetical protein [Gemmatimonadaceae bacterium]
NDRAARFYEKRGWHRTGTMANKLDGVSIEMDLDVWRYEKRLVTSIASPSSGPLASPDAPG